VSFQNNVIVSEDQPNLVVIRTGQAAANTRRHVHAQAAVSDTWTINHTLGGKPSVTIVDSANTVVVGEVQYSSDLQVVVTFTAPFSGYAYLT